MRSLIKKAPVAVITLSSLALVTGCHTNKGSSSHYTSTPAPITSTGAPMTWEDKSAGGADLAASAPSATASEMGTNIVIPLYQESVKVGTRRVDAGSVRLRKVVKTETVNQPVQVRRETLVVDRESATGQEAAPGGTSGQAGASLAQPFQEQEMVIQLWREEPLVETQVVPQGRIVAQTRTEAQQMNVQRQVRREDIAVTKEGSAENVTISQNVMSSAGGATAVGGGGDVGSQSQGTGAGGPISDVTRLTTGADAATLAGRPVQISRAQVQDVVSDRLIALSGQGGRPIYVRLSQPMENLKQGDTVNLSGTIKQVPSSTASLGLSDEAVQALKGQSIYVDAQRIEPTGQSR